MRAMERMEGWLHMGCGVVLTIDNCSVSKLERRI